LTCRLGAAAVCLLAARELRRVSLETHHTFGVIAYSEEHEAPRHFRQVDLDMLRYGGLGRTEELLAEHLLGDNGAGLPENDFGPAAESFWLEARTWLTEYWTDERKARQRALSFKTWPAKFGGLERSGDQPCGVADGAVPWRAGSAEASWVRELMPSLVKTLRRW
jgi:hypothetical protein